MSRPWLLLVSLLCLPSAALAVDYTVDTTTSAVDATPGDGQCRTAAGQCSLRAAVQEANARPGLDLIRFNIGAGGVQQINLAHTDAGGNTSSLAISDALSIDGSTQPGFSGDPLIGVHCTNAFDGLIVGAANVQIRHLAFTGFPQAGLQLDASGALVENVWFGRKPDGLTLSANGIGVEVNGSGNLIQDSRFHRNNVVAMAFRPSGSDNWARRSFFAFGGYPAGNGCVAGSAPLVQVSGSNQRVGPGNVIGGTSGHAVLFENAANSSLTGNFIGLDAFGVATCLIGSSVAIFGGSGISVGDNVIAGLGGHGVHADGVAGLMVYGNRLGLRADGSPFGNGGDGLRVEDSTEVLVGTGPGGTPKGNHVGANLGSGIGMLGSFFDISWNWIGTDSSGNRDLGNQGDGVYVGSGAGAVHHNLIGFNANGVALTGDATRVDERDNSYNRNSGLPVDLGRDGPTANDAGDGDSGPNGRLNTIEAVVIGSNELVFDEFLTGLGPGAYEVRVHRAEDCLDHPNGGAFGIDTQFVGLGAFAIGDTQASASGAMVSVPIFAEFPAWTLQVRDPARGVSSELSRCFRRSGGWLGDRVWRDLNRDGLQGENEPGIPGVLVELYRASGSLVGTRITGADGRYRFADLASDSYRLRFALAPGHSHTLADVGGDDRIDSDVVTPAGSTAVFGYTAGSVDSTRDSGQVPEIHCESFEGYSVQLPPP